jgi:hypothetical protein
MNYIPIHTNIYPNYNYLSAENAYLKQSIEYKDAVLQEQQTKITQLQADVAQLSQASNGYKQERDQYADDAQRWKIMQRIIKTQGDPRQMYEVTKIVDREIECERARTGSMEPSNRRSA